MTTIPVTYAIGVDGAERALAEMKAIERETQRQAEMMREIDAAEKAAYAEDRVRTAQRLNDIKSRSQAQAKALQDAITHATESGSASRNVLGGINAVSDGLKAVSRDIDAVAGNASAGFAKWASDALGVASALGTGGLLGGVAALSAGVGLAVTAYTQWKNEADASYQASVAALAAERERFDKLYEYAGKALAEQKKKTVEDLHQISIARQAAVVVLDTEIAIQRAKKATATNAADFAREAVALDKLVADRAVAVSKASEAQETYRHEKAVERHKDLVARDTKRTEEAKQRSDERAKSEASEYERGYAKFYESQNRKARAFEKAKQDEMTAAERAKKVEEDGAAAMLYLAELERQEAEDTANANERAQEKSRAAEEKRTEAIRRQREAIEQRTEAERINIINTQASAAASISYGVAMTVVTPIVNEFTGALRQLGDVNRDNYRDFLIEAEQLPAIIARKAQAIMAGIAAEATGKAIFETGEGLRETALGLGLIAIPGMQGQAAGHFASAGTHFLAANAYGVLGSGAAVGAIGIGAARGDSAGSLIGLTKEEREKRDRDRGGGGGGGGLGGSSNSRGRNDAGQTVVNVNMEFGAYAIVPDNPRRIARAFAMGERAARRDGFARLNG